MTATFGVPCRLSSKAGRAALRSVLAQIRERHPADFARIKRVVLDVRPLTPDQTADGTQGQWIELHPSADDPATWGYGYDETPGVAYLDEQLPRNQLCGLIAHELGHACAVGEDLEYTGGPRDEWREELTADRYAYKWGFGRAIGSYRKGRDWVHHCAAPGQIVSEGVGRKRVRFRVTRRFRLRPL